MNRLEVFVKKLRCLVTAGPTREYFDSVRFISNPSSGKMGWHIANAAERAGWETTLVLGPSGLPDASCSRTVRVVSAQDMLEECLGLFCDTDILIMSAAVSDVRPKVRVGQKVKKADIDLNPQLERTPDILATLSQMRRAGQILVGFAAETHNVLEYAAGKLEQKNLDCVVANDVSAAGLGFASDYNRVCLVLRGAGTVDLGNGPKEILAEKLVGFIAERFVKNL